MNGQNLWLDTPALCETMSDMTEKGNPAGGLHRKCSFPAPIYRLLIAPALVLACIYFIFWPVIYSNYYPYGDDPSAFASSNQAFAGWFSTGFSDFSVVYPEWSVSSTDFMRPGSSLIFRLNQTIFGQHYALYFAESYLLQFLLVALVIMIGRDLGLRRSWLAGVGLMVAISPAFMHAEFLAGINGQVDLVCAILGLASFLLLYRNHRVLVLIPMTLAIFTKEAAFYVPVAACLAAYSSTKKRLVSLSMLAPVAFYFLVRTLFFAGSSNRVYALPANDARALTLQIVKGFLLWPTGVLNEGAAKVLISGRSALFAHLADVLLIFVNLLMWAGLSGLIWLLLRPQSTSKVLFRDNRPAMEMLTIWTGTALAFGVLGVKLRYGAPIFPFELLLLAAISHQASHVRLRVVAMSASAILVCVFLWQAQYTLRRNDPDFGFSSQRMNATRRLIGAIHLHQSKGETIYVIDAPSGSASPGYFASFFGIPSRVVIMNEFDGCLSSSEGSTEITEQGNTIHLTQRLPKCAEITFSMVPKPKLTPAFGGTLLRGLFSSYSLPEGRIVGYAVRSKEPLTDFGRTLDITIKSDPSEKHILVYYDWRTSKFNCIGLRCGGPS